MQIEKVLENIGMSPNEIKVYLTLTDNGTSKAGKIAKLSQIDRSSCYNSLKKLIEKGLVSYVIMENVKWFQVAGPRRLLDYVKEQEEEVKEILPELQGRHKANKQEGQVRLFKGTKGIKTIFLDMIRTGSNNYVFGSEGQLSDRMPEFVQQFNRMKNEKGIKTKMIIRKGRDELDNSNSKHRFLNVKSSPAVTNIYGDKIAIIIWTDEPEGIIIENEAAAKAYKSYFDVMWEKAE